MNHKRYIRVTGDIVNNIFSLNQVMEYLKGIFHTEVELDMSASAWSSDPNIYAVGPTLPSYFDLSCHPEIKVLLVDDKLSVYTNFDPKRNYNEGPKCECGIEATKGKEYHWHSHWCPLYKKS